LLPALERIQRVMPPAGPPAAGKDVRTGYSDVPNLLTSENFAVWWGTQGDISESSAQALIDSFESSWDAIVGELAHEPPEGSSDYLFNVYIGSTGNGTPSDYGAAGYYYRDPQGWPMVVVSAGTARDQTDYGRSIVPHEFYHAVQDQTANYAYSGSSGFTDGSWFWEATAIWVVNEVFPDDTWHSVYLFGYLLVPERPLNDFTYPDGSLAGYHQYGAFLFPRYLTEHVVEPSLIVQTWKDGTSSGDPLQVLGDLVADQGMDLGELFTDFAARNVLYDYIHGETYQDVVDAYAPYYPGDDHRVTEVVRGDGDRAWFQVDEDLAPGPFGYNLIRFEWPDDGDLVIEFDGQIEGRERSEATWGLALVWTDDEGSAIELLDASEGAWRLEDVDGMEAVTLVVASIPQDAGRDERFDYRWRMSIERPVPEILSDPDPEGEDVRFAACGCRSPGQGSAWLAVLVMAVLVRRREQATAVG
jgi:MYXO-CTERM domain-containing protein